MNKLKLEDLAIDSFDTTAAETDRSGTVFGEQCTCQTNCTCPGCPSCDPSYCDTACNTCPGTCGGSCNFTCEAYGTCDYTCVNYATCSWNTVCEA